MKDKYSILKDILKYNPDIGNIYYNTGERLNITEDLFCYVYININSTKCKIKIKYSNLIWYLVNGILPDSKQKIHHRDLNPTNFKYSNLILVSNNTYFKIKEYIYNLQEGLKLYPHKKDAYNTVLEYRDKGRLKREIYYDLGTAKQAKLRYQCRMLKYLGEYILTE